jgi:hypothetical protein
MPCPYRAHVALCRGPEKSLSERHSRSMARARHGRGMACVNQTRPHCVNQMGKTQSKPLAARHVMARERHRRGMGTAWYVWISLKTARSMYKLFIGIKLKVIIASCWYLLYTYIMIHGPQNIKNVTVVCVFCVLQFIFQGFLLMLNIYSITPTKCTHFIYYTTIPCFSYMFRCFFFNLN